MRRPTVFNLFKFFFVFIFGCLCGAAAIELRNHIREGAKALDALDNTEAHSDSEVRRRIRGSGINLPESSWNLFYAINGFQDHGVWIAFTVPRDQIWIVIEACLGKSKEDFMPGIPNEFLVNVEMGPNQKIDTTIWNPTNINHPVHFSIRGRLLEDWVVDEDTGRIFVTKSNT